MATICNAVCVLAQVKLFLLVEKLCHNLMLRSEYRNQTEVGQTVFVCSVSCLARHVFRYEPHN
jgi:hypothetical protein